MVLRPLPHYQVGPARRRKVDNIETLQAMARNVEAERRRQDRLALLHSVAAWYRTRAKDLHEANSVDTEYWALCLEALAAEMLEVFEATTPTSSESSTSSDAPTSGPSGPHFADLFPGST